MIPGVALPDTAGLRGVGWVDPIENTEPAAGPRQEILARLQRIGLGRRIGQSPAPTAVEPQRPPTAAAAVMSASTPAAPDPIAAGVDGLRASAPTPTAAPHGGPGVAVLAGDTAVLSTIGRWVDILLRTAPAIAGPKIGAGRVLMAPSGKVDTSTLASVLQRTVETTGLFYEAHLAEWARGERFLEHLQLEPQFDWQPRAGAGARGAEAPAAEQVTVLAQQLQTLDQQRFAWNGEAWSGQPLHWELGRDPEASREGVDAADAGGAWRTTLRLKLPALGGITATIRLDGERVAMTIAADGEAAAAALRARGGELIDRLSAVGIVTSGLKVDRHDPV